MPAQNDGDAGKPLKPANELGACKVEVKTPSGTQISAEGWPAVLILVLGLGLSVAFGRAVVDVLKFW